ncbi:transposase [Ruminococcus sp.]|uniref:transposase n=1 Tax=Ruminococcus sp. TaxID=41978 RepID=UPI001B071AFB|nr:transposase [Ruminococcus sp.]MBO5557604.1 transposase [Ruminococcus sp.]
MNYYNRKYPRLKKFDYVKSGYYHVTICTIKRLPILSKIKLEKRSDGVGRGLAPTSADHASVVLSPIGRIAEEQLMKLNERYPCVHVYNYVIMPDHLHIIFRIAEDKAGASPRPTLMEVVCSFKSLVTNICNKRTNKQGRKIFQTSFYDTVIWNEEQLQQVSEYISRNPDRWAANTERFGKNKYLYIKE